MSFGGTQKPSVLPVPPPAPVMPGLNTQFQSLFSGGVFNPYQQGSPLGPTPINPGSPSGVSFLGPPSSSGGGAGGPGAGTGIPELQATALGLPGSPGSATDVNGLFEAIKKASASTQQQGFGQIQAAFAGSGASMSSDMMAALSKYNVDYGSQLNQTLADLLFKSTETAKGRQLAASSTLEETFGNAAMAFAPTGEVVGGAGNSNLGGSLTQAGTEIGGMLLMLGVLGFL